MKIQAILSGLMTLASVGVAVHGAETCSEASRLTDEEARILLYVTPAAVSARETGTDVDVEKSPPTKQFPADRYFVGVVISQEPTGGGLLGNGILGYFAVDKRTASVAFVGDFTPVRGKELARIQEWMRRAHCISPPAGSAGKVGK
jgi:hypothetical protein